MKKHLKPIPATRRDFLATGGARGHIDSFETYLKDIRALARVIRGEEPDKKIFLVGESLGGLISFLAAGEPAPGTGGLVCLSAAFKSRLHRARLRFLAALHGDRHGH